MEEAESPNSPGEVQCGEGEATFKQLEKYGKTRALHPLNHKFDDIELSREIEYRIIGAVVDKKKTYNNMISGLAG